MSRVSYPLFMQKIYFPVFDSDGTALLAVLSSTWATRRYSSLIWISSVSGSYFRIRTLVGDRELQTKDPEPLERVHSIKLLGVHMTDTLKWDDHVKHLASSCYGVLVALRKIKNFTNYHLRKYLVESLVLSRLDFNDIIYYPITDCLLKRLQRIQFAAASFVFGRYVNNIDSILKLGWLPT